jgi:hypothetical protein
MRILGATLREVTPAGGRGALVALDALGALTSSAPFEGVGALTREVARLAAGEPFLLAVDLAIVAPQGPGKPRRVDGWIHRRLGLRLAASRAGAGLYGADLITALATAGHPALPYPDRDRRRTGLVEIHPELVLKAIVWESSSAAASQLPDREDVLRALEVPVYRGARLARAAWADRFAALDRAIRVVAGAPGFDHPAIREELTKAVTVDAVDRAAAAFDASLLASAARRYLEEPERCAFVGDRETGYTVVPADAFLRRVVLRESARGADRGALFPRASLRERLKSHADVRPLELLDLPGRAQHFEAVFRESPLFEFDNVDEMLWWKHCRHLNGPEVPQEGLKELVVKLDTSAASADGSPLRLTRSRHKTLSFRFEPPQTWRARIAPRDGRTYPFRVLRATYEG